MKTDVKASDIDEIKLVYQLQQYWSSLMDVSMSAEFCVAIDTLYDTESKLWRSTVSWYPPFNVKPALLRKYEGWNFNSGNYLFTTDTK